jgi:hypothetical protein
VAGDSGSPPATSLNNVAEQYYNEYSGSSYSRRQQINSPQNINHSTQEHHHIHQRQYNQTQVYPSQEYPQQDEPRGLESLDELSEPLLNAQQMAHQRPPPHLGGGNSHLYGHTSGKPRARTHEELELDLGLREDEDDHEVEQHYHLPPPSHIPPQQAPPQQQHHHHTPHTPQQHPQHAQQSPHHHHHHIPDHPPPPKIARTDPRMSMGGGSPNSPGMIGIAGASVVAAMAGAPSSQQMPSPSPRPRGPKMKFTPEDDTLLVDLKENKSLTWKQIADFFPGRSSGTLQVRYCTKLKAKTTQWTDETVR